MKSRKILQRPPPKSLNPPPNNRLESDGNDDLIEVEQEEHRYDPGYHPDGNTEPLLSATGPNKGGYVLILFGALIVLATLLAVRSGAIPWFFGIVIAAIPVLFMLVGVKIVKGG